MSGAVEFTAAGGDRYSGTGGDQLAGLYADPGDWEDETKFGRITDSSVVFVSPPAERTTFALIAMPSDAYIKNGALRSRPGQSGGVGIRHFVPKT